MTTDDAIRKWQQLGAAGLTVSIAYGYCGENGLLFSVNVLSRDFIKEFERPFAARSFEQAVEIADIECRERGWLQSNME